VLERDALLEEPLDVPEAPPPVAPPIVLPASCTQPVTVIVLLLEPLVLPLREPPVVCAAAALTMYPALTAIAIVVAM